MHTRVAPNNKELTEILSYAGRKMLSRNPTAHLHPEPNQETVTIEKETRAKKTEREETRIFGKSTTLRGNTLLPRRLCLVPSSSSECI